MVQTMEILLGAVIIVLVMMQTLETLLGAAGIVSVMVQTLETLLGAAGIVSVMVQILEMSNVAASSTASPVMFAMSALASSHTMHLNVAAQSTTSLTELVASMFMIKSIFQDTLQRRVVVVSIIATSSRKRQLVVVCIPAKTP